MAQHPDFSLGGTASAAEGDLRLPTPPGVIRQFWARHPWWTDSLVATVFTLPALLGALLAASSYSGFWIGLLGIAVAFGSGALVLFRRHAPLTMFAIAVAVAFLSYPLQNGIGDAAVAFLLYAVAVYHSSRWAWIGLGIAVAGTVAIAFSPWASTLSSVESSQSIIITSIVMLVATLLGVNVGNRKRYVAALIDRAAQLARERDQQAQISAAAERSRIAREMHDIVSHSLTVMVTLSEGSAALAANDPERSATAMREVAETGRSALTDMRRMLGVLNEGSGTQDEAASQLVPQPGAAELATLIERFRAAGLPVRFSTTGIPVEEPGLQLTIYRVVQESLTNVLRHAPMAGSVDAFIVYEPTGLTVGVDDSGKGNTGTTTTTQGSGRGLIGMRERVAAYGGTLESGPRPSGGWRVRARFGATTTKDINP